MLTIMHLFLMNLPMTKNGVTKTSEHIGMPISDEKPKPEIKPNRVDRTPIADRYIGDCENDVRNDRHIVATKIIKENVPKMSFISNH
jgi:hypothetical protein